MNETSQDYTTFVEGRVKEVLRGPLSASEREAFEEKIAKAFHVPYWIITGRPEPSWFRRPVWRWRARRWDKVHV